MESKITECRLNHNGVLQVNNGMTAWIVKAEKYGHYGVRYYPSDFTPMPENLGVDGIYTPIEKL